MFESDGKLKAKSSYGNLAELKAADPNATKHPGYKAAMNLWARMFSDSTWENGKKSRPQSLAVALDVSRRGRKKGSRRSK